MRNGVVLDGGGGKCSFQVGAMEAFEERGIHFERIQGVSAGCLNAAKYAESGAKDLTQIWLNLEKNGPHSLFGWWASIIRHSLGNALFNDATLFKLVAALDINKILDSPIDFEAVVWNELTEGTEIFSSHVFKDQNGNPEVFQKIIKASASLPGGFAPVEINGQLYSDGCEIILEYFKDFDFVFIINVDQPLVKVDIAELARMFWAKRLLKRFSTLIDRCSEKEIANFVRMHRFKLLSVDGGEVGLPILKRLIRLLDELVGAEKQLVVISPSLNIPTLRLDYWQQGDITKSIKHGYERTIQVLDRLKL